MEFSYDDKEVTKLSGVGSLNFSKYNNLIDLVYNEFIINSFTKY